MDRARRRAECCTDRARATAAAGPVPVRAVPRAAPGRRPSRHPAAGVRGIAPEAVPPSPRSPRAPAPRPASEPPARSEPCVPHWAGSTTSPSARWASRRPCSPRKLPTVRHPVGHPSEDSTRFANRRAGPGQRSDKRGREGWVGAARWVGAGVADGRSPGAVASWNAEPVGRISGDREDEVSVSIEAENGWFSGAAGASRLGAPAMTGRLSDLAGPLPPPRRRSASVPLGVAPVPVPPFDPPLPGVGAAARSGVTLFPAPSPLGPACTEPSSGIAPPRAIAAKDTALAAAKTNLRPSQGERSASLRPTSWIRKPPPEPGSTVACAPAGT